MELYCEKSLAYVGTIQHNGNSDISTFASIFQNCNGIYSFDFPTDFQVQKSVTYTQIQYILLIKNVLFFIFHNYYIYI